MISAVCLFGFKLDLRASKDYDGKKLTCQAEVSELLQQLFEYKQETLVTQKMRELIKPENPDNTRVKVEIIIVVKYLLTLQRHDENWSLLDWNCTNWWRNKSKINISNLPKFYCQPIGQ